MKILPQAAPSPLEAAFFALKKPQDSNHSLKSDNMIVRIFAILDRRVGKRRLINMYPTIDPQEEVFKLFYSIRTNAERLVLK